MGKYRVESYDTGTNVLVFNGSRWVCVVAFVNDNHRQMAMDWVKHEEYLDQLDNA